MQPESELPPIRDEFARRGYDLHLTQTSGGMWEARWVAKGQPVSDWPLTSGTTRLEAARAALGELRAEPS